MALLVARGVVVSAPPQLNLALARVNRHTGNSQR